LLALASLAEHENEVDAARALSAIGAIKAELDSIRRLKTQLTSIRSSAAEVATGLDRLRDQVLARVAEAEAQLQPAVAS
jgi:hypothetical protein